MLPGRVRASFVATGPTVRAFMPTAMPSEHSAIISSPEAKHPEHTKPRSDAGSAWAGVEPTRGLEPLTTCLQVWRLAPTTLSAASQVADRLSEPSDSSCGDSS